MRKNKLIVIALLLMSVAAQGGDNLKKMIKDGKASVSGYLNTSTIPYSLELNHGLKNKETLFLNNLKTEDALLLDKSYVTVSGKVEIYQKVQYMISVETIRPAKKEELKKFE